MLSVKYGIDENPLTWKYLRIGDGIFSATFTCPKKHTGSLLDHSILDNGRVEPSVRCNLCDFHDFVLLEGWNHQGPKIENQSP